jgi:hypothetical protein
MTPAPDPERRAPAEDEAAPRAPARRWPGLAVLLATVSAFLAWGAVAPASSTGSTRLGILSLSWPAVLCAAAVFLSGLWAHRRGLAGPLWLAGASLVPWLPLPAWGALLLWHGPAALVPLGSAVLLVAWPALARAAAFVRSRTPRRQATVAFVACAVLYGLAGWRMQPQLPGGDEPHYLVITQSLLLDRDLRIENNHTRGDYRAYTAQALRPDSLKRGTDGQIYSVHAPGVSVLVLPAFAMAGYPGAVVWLVLIASIGATLAWWSTWRLFGDAGAAWAGWSVVALSAPFFFESFTVFPDGPGAVLVMACAAALTMPSMLATPRRALALGCCAAMLPWLHTRYALLAGALGLVLGLRIADQAVARASRLAAFFAVPAGSAALWLSFFYWTYGTFSPAAPYGGYTQTALSNAPRGLTGLLVDQQFGILPNAPAYAIAFLGVGALWRVRRRVAVELAAVVVPYTVAVASYHMWWGGRSAVARFAVPVLLPLALPAAAFWQRAGRTGRAFAVAAIASSAAIACGLAWVDRGALVYNVRDGYSLWADALAPLVRLPLALPSLFRGTPAQAWTVALAWTAAFAAAVLAVRALERARAMAGAPPGVRGLGAIVAGTALLAATGAAAIGWHLDRGSAVDAGTAAVRLARRAELPGSRSWTTSAPWRLSSPTALATSLWIPTAERRPTDPAAPAWSAGGLPPGRYEVRSTSGLRVAGTVTAFLGRETRPVAQATLRDAAPGLLPLAVDLPAGAASLRLAADAEARRTAGTFELRLAEPVRVPGRPAGAFARAWLAGPARAWFLDRNAWVEPDAFWVRGGADTTFVVDATAGARLVLRAGPVATTASVTFDGAPARALSLAAGDTAVVDVRAGSPVAVRVGSSSGFRPRDHDPSNPDSRWLGVRVALERR